LRSTWRARRAYRDVQSRVHPDKFVMPARRKARGHAVGRANEAYQTLKIPQKRAQYLCELNGVDLQTESNTAMPWLS
jgi:molecular chaperone HscB